MLPSSISTDSRLHSSSSSSSSNSSSSPSPFSLLPNSRTMEEVWKDITISSLPTTPLSHHNNHHIHHPTPSSNFRGMILQDFLNSSENPQNRASTDYGCPPPPPGTILSLNSGPQFQFLENNSHCNQIQSTPVSNYSVFGTGDGGENNSSVLAYFGGKKRFSELSDENVSGSGSVDRRHKRMIKNRESAARSRARKQAYVTELEDKVKKLQEENERLMRQQQQFIEAPSCAQPPKKHGLHRTSTAPF